MEIIKRLKRLWRLSDPEVQFPNIAASYFERDGGFVIEQPSSIKGNGGALLLSDMTDEQHEQFVHEEDHGWKKFYKRLFPN
jgi:hypothetical protein